MKHCCIIGMGYIGLPTAALLCSSGYKVSGVDIDERIVNKINSGEVHIHEPGLEKIVKSSIQKGILNVKKSPVKADIFIICVPTPIESNKINPIPKPNLDYVYAAAESIAKVLEKGNLIVLESTSPVGTTKRIAELIEKKSGLSQTDFYLSYCPERVIPGDILNELIINDRVIGGINQLSSERCRDFYETFCKGSLLLCEASTAELVKLSENSYRDINIAFANELSMICSKYKINTNQLIKLANKHPRVNIHNPGCGVGGHCIAVDPWFIASQLPNESKLIQKARETNLAKTRWVIKKIEKRVNEIKSIINCIPKIGFLGLAYKANVDDLRESPALFIVKHFLEKKNKCYVCEPFLKEHKDIKLSSLETVIQESDIVIFLVAHDLFKNIDIENKPFEDFCGLYN